MRFCKKCDCVTERYASGKCAPCARLYAASRNDSPERKASVAKYNAQKHAKHPVVSFKAGDFFCD